ncbi:MAG: urease accessory protein UreE [Streptococcus hyointestinalis]|uniref:urease accessory protein UreE n=1 Tax=Streptococcus hyointestinalis TaxID=1337 RepID=UPI0023EFB1EC|nr:urease accessory protein UreE [Streptococcus hyointestinalis]MCI6872003.1 urease accessory protein UreE [Streptococcus hyointestinalis]MDD7355881.1 urease accessory protein UreE [Streptococcus hyointestinalis]MDY4553951.1 urease accessory protein UreE [Streptococcus hyointestinalis]
MILTDVFNTVDELENLSDFHIETAMVKSDDLMKSILRVTTDHGNDYGIRLSDSSQVLENGSAFKLSDGELLVLSVIPDEMIVVKPSGIDEMGELAHMLGNLHKPVQIADGTISLLFDKVVAETLKARNIPFAVESIQLEQPLRYADLSL